MAELSISNYMAHQGKNSYYLLSGLLYKILAKLVSLCCAICNYTGVKCLVAAVQRLAGGTDVCCCKIVLSYRKWQTYFIADFKG